MTVSSPRTNHENPSAHLVSLARTIAAQHALDPALVCAVVEQESAWNANAIRYEPAFRMRYVAPLTLPATEEIARSISWGLMQVMGQVAREHGFTGKFLSALCDPAAGLDIGCIVLASKFAAAARELAAEPSPSSLPATPAGQIPAASGQGIDPPAPSSPLVPGDRSSPSAALVRRALLLWNGGADPDYPSQVLARTANFQ